MASRESQGLQIALILFVMVTVVLAITTYVYFRKSEEKIKEAQAARVQAKQAQDAANAVQFENQVLKHVLGYERKTDAELTSIKQGLGGNKQMEEVLTNFGQDMVLYGTGLPPEDLHYRNLPKHLVTAVHERNVQLADANSQIKVLQAEKDQARDAEAKRTAQVAAELEKTTTDYTGVRAKFNEDRTKVTTDMSQLATRMTEKDKQFQQATATAQKEKEDLQKRLDLTAQLADTYKTRLESFREPTYETPVGEIKWVDQRARIVWITLGTADGVTRMMTFSVVDQKETGVTKAKIKGRIEVTTVKEEHLAEARILEDELANPIMLGDKLYSPTFKKGQRIRFALAGLMDIDGDGKSDQTKVKSIITTGGGVVDAELLEDGSIAGKMTMETRYLVLGQRPTDKTNVKLTEGYTRIIGEASQLGIETMALDKLLDRMGYVAEQRVVDLTRGGGAGGQGGAAKPSPFRKRAPGSAY